MLIKNSILSGFIPDPSPCRFDNDYCIFTSVFERFFGVQMNLCCDFADWRLIGHVSELPVAAAGKLFLPMENRFAELRLSWSIDRTTVDQVFDATMPGDLVSPHSNFTFTFWGICCQDLSNRFAWANFDCFNYQPQNMP